MRQLELPWMPWPRTVGAARRSHDRLSSGYFRLSLVFSCHRLTLRLTRVGEDLFVPRVDLSEATEVAGELHG